MATQPEATGPQRNQEIPGDTESNRNVFAFINTQLQMNRAYLSDLLRYSGIAFAIIIAGFGFVGYRSLQDFQDRVQKELEKEMRDKVAIQFADPKLKELINKEAVKAVEAQAGPTIRDTTKKWEINILMGRIQNDDAFAFDELTKLARDSGISSQNLALAKDGLRQIMQKYDSAPTMFGGFPASIPGQKENELILKFSSPIPMERRRALAELIPTVWADPAKLYNVATTDPFLSVRCDAARVLAVRLKHYNFPTACLAKQEMLDLWPHIAKVVQ